MTTLPQPGPREPDPLSSRERRILAGIEKDLDATAPDLGDLARSLSRGPPRARPARDRVLEIAAVLTIVILVVPANWLPVLVVVGVMAGLPLAAALAGRRGTGEGEPDRDD